MLLSPATTYQPADAQLEIASLETDIMRFLAILGFCLMIIFALVQSIPVSKSEESLTQGETTQQQLKLQTKSQQLELSELMIENMTLKQTLTQAETALKALSNSLTSEQQKLKGIEHQLNQKNQKLQDMQATNTKTGAQLNQQKNIIKVVKIKQTALKKSAQKSKKNSKANTKENKKTIEKSQKQAKTKKGFSLQFESDDAFKQLVLNKQVTLYVSTGDGYLRYQNGRYSKVAVNQTLYKMNEATVPQTFIKLLKGFEQGNVTWSVALPDITTNELNRLMSEHRQGAIYIGKQGKVRYQQ
jgi:hypothetical protein